MKNSPTHFNPHPSRVRKSVASNLRLARSKLKMTRKGLAQKADVETVTIQRIETQKANTHISTLARIRVALNVSWRYLLKDI